MNHSCFASQRLITAFLLALVSFCGLGDSTFAQNAETPTQEKEGEAKQSKKARPKTEPNQFLRIRKDAKGKAKAMETSITRYEMTTEAGGRISVDLIGVVHIGETEYYQLLNKKFEQYESLLYELVAPEGTVIPKGGRDNSEGMTNPLAAMQMGMKSVLGLEFQLDHIDYTKSNFQHADMTPEEFGESMSKNEESVGGYALKALGQSMAMQAAGKGDDSFSMLFSMMGSNSEIKMRRNFAKKMIDMDAGMIIFEGKDGSTIIDHRNAKCMEVLQREIDKGKRNLAIFYGAGHLNDMERRLIKDFGMKRAGRTWLTAWNLETPKK